MRIKGIAFKSTVDFVQTFYPERFQEWINSMSEYAREYYINPIDISEWYPTSAFEESRKKLADLFHDSNYEASTKIVVRYGAEKAIKGIYKAFITIATTNFMIARAGNLLSAYYDDADINFLDHTSNFAIIRMNKYPCSDKIYEISLCTWIEVLLEKVGRTEIKIQKICSLADGDSYSEYHVSWI
ncbi:MAG: hypothetical protein WCT77_05650 [Bacteroidota bacterium]